MNNELTYIAFVKNETRESGYQVTSGTTTYNYDFENHLVNIDFPNTNNDDNHEYDGVGRRMRSKLNGATDWTNFIFDELTDNLICEYTLISGTFTIKSLNTWGIGLISTNREGTKRYFHFDGLGSTVALTDFDMNVTDTYVYSAFGVTESSSGSSVNPFRFVGQWGYYDDGARGSQSGLLLLGVRYYSPLFGRFWSWDPIPDENQYLYVKNQLCFLIDPLGLRGTSIGAGMGRFARGAARIGGWVGIGAAVWAGACGWCIMSKVDPIIESFGTRVGEDAWLHCMYGCLTRIRCTALCGNWVLGLLKEIPIDAVFGGTVELPRDLANTTFGVDCAKAYLPSYGSDAEHCHDCCRTLEPPPLGPGCPVAVPVIPIEL